MMTQTDILKTQIDYYRARAQEYDESISQTGRFAHEPKVHSIDAEFNSIMAVVQELPQVDAILELASGTGIWTSLLVNVGKHITAVDASPEMHAINREKVQSDRVEYVLADLFEWKPKREYDLVFFGFFLSHVPHERFDAFMNTIREAVRPGGKVFIVDESVAVPEELAVTDGQYQERTLSDGRQYTIVKVYYAPGDIQTRLEQIGFGNVSYQEGNRFFHLSGTRAG